MDAISSLQAAVKPLKRNPPGQDPLQLSSSVKSQASLVLDIPSQHEKHQQLQSNPWVRSVIVLTQLGETHSSGCISVCLE